MHAHECVHARECMQAHERTHMQSFLTHEQLDMMGGVPGLQAMVSGDLSTLHLITKQTHS